MSIPAVCLTLLISSGPSISPVTPAQEAAAAEWLKNHDVPDPTPAQIQSALEQWQKWNSAPVSARNANLALELKDLAPESEATVFSLRGREELKKRSAQNLIRLKIRLSERIPLLGQPDPATKERIEVLHSNITLHYLMRDRRTKHTGLHGPLASARELARLQLSQIPEFYSDLVGSSRSVPFRIIATKAKSAPYSLNAQVPFDALRLNNELAEDAGFVVPSFENQIELIRFFYEWEPELIPTLLQHNRIRCRSV